VQATPLGQVGFRFQFDETVAFIDPYLTDYVADQFGANLKRRIAAPFHPDEIRDAQWVFITHAHADHADPTSLGPIARSSPRARFVCTYETEAILAQADVDPSRIVLAEEKWSELREGLSVKTVPAAHLSLERNDKQQLRYAGFLFRHKGKLFYHAGDTIPHPEIFESLKKEGPIDYAFFPVNERNYFRDQQGIIGNMSIREAFAMAEELRVRVLIPTHWDLFQPNSVFPEEIEFLHQKLAPNFKLQICPVGQKYVFE
jgi:L-ascorbate metabolism protein UlaG (beta-lactamase superfamily)